MMPDYKLKVAPKLRVYLGAHPDWEQHLEPQQLEALAGMRGTLEMKPDGIPFFARMWAHNREQPDYLEDMDEAGDDPVAQAQAEYELEMYSYPFAPPMPPEFEPQ